MKRYVAEAIGTFTLVFAGTGAIVINDVSHGAITHVGIALTFGLVVMAMVWLWLLIHRFRLAWLEHQIEHLDLADAIALRRAEGTA